MSLDSSLWLGWTGLPYPALPSSPVSLSPFPLSGGGSLPITTSAKLESSSVPPSPVAPNPTSPQCSWFFYRRPQNLFPPSHTFPSHVPPNLILLPRQQLLETLTSAKNPLVTPVTFRSKAKSLTCVQGPHRQPLPADLPAHLPRAQHCPLLLESQGPQVSAHLLQLSPHLGFPFHLHLQCHLFEAFHDSCQFTSPSSDFSKHPTPTPMKPVLILDTLICVCSYLNSALLTGGHATLKKYGSPDKYCKFSLTSMCRI